MKVSHVLLTGAGGKIGRAVLPELVQAGYSVRALEYTDGLQVEHLDRVEVVTGDLRDASLAKQLVKDMDVVIHLANVKENRGHLLPAGCLQGMWTHQAVYPSRFRRASGYLLLSPTDSHR